MIPVWKSHFPNGSVSWLVNWCCLSLGWERNQACGLGGRFLLTGPHHGPRAGQHGRLHSRAGWLVLKGRVPGGPGGYCTSFLTWSQKSCNITCTITDPPGPQGREHGPHLPMSRGRACGTAGLRMATFEIICHGNPFLLRPSD